MNKRKIIRIYTINEVKVPVDNTFVVHSRNDIDVGSGQNNKLIRTGIFFPDHNQKDLDFDVYYIRSDYIPIKAFLLDHELAVVMMFDSDKSFTLYDKVEIASIKIRDYGRIAFVDSKKENIKLRTNEVNINENSDSDNTSKFRS